MINKYLNDLDAFISASSAVADFDIIRRDIRDTGLEKIALYRYRIELKDGSTIDLTERLCQQGKKLDATKYRCQWQAQSGKVIKRWDNAPHHPEIDTFPDHLHVGFDDNVVRFNKISVLNILTGIINTLNLDD